MSHSNNGRTRLDEPPAEELAAMLSPEEADIILRDECPAAVDVSLSERVWLRRAGRKEKFNRLCQAVLLIPGPGGGIDVSGTNWNDVIGEVRRQYDGSRQRSA